jgi:hypothetical protein
VIRENHRLNNSPGDLSVYGEATPETLLRLSEDDFNNTLVLVDIEGAEFELFTRSVCERLRACTVLIEIHHWVDNFWDKYSTFLTVAVEFFKISVIEPQARPVNNAPELRHFPDVNRLILASEGRPCQMRFIKLEPK